MPGGVSKCGGSTEAGGGRGDTGDVPLAGFFPSGNHCSEFLGYKCGDVLKGLGRVTESSCLEMRDGYDDLFFFCDFSLVTAFLFRSRPRWLLLARMPALVPVPCLERSSFPAALQIPLKCCDPRKPFLVIPAWGECPFLVLWVPGGAADTLALPWVTQNPFVLGSHLWEHPARPGTILLQPQ